MIKNITHKELVSILMQIHDELSSRFFQHWIRVAINKLNSYEDKMLDAQRELAFYKKSFEAIQKREAFDRKWNRKVKTKRFFESLFKK
jgi:hypothetical protein